MKLPAIKRGFKNLVNYFFDIILVLSVAATLASSYVLWFVLPRGLGTHSAMCARQGQGLGGNYYTALGMSRYTWVEIHNWLSVILLGIIILHIVLHWSWIVETLRRTKSYFSGPVRKVAEQYIASVLLFILFVADCFSGFVLWLILPRGSLDYYNMLSGSGRTFWGLQRDIWVDIHAWIATLIVSIIIIHIILNWKWVVSVSKKILKWCMRLFYGKKEQEQ